MSDSALSQPALLCLPGSKISDFMDALKRLARPDAPAPRLALFSDDFAQQDFVSADLPWI